jgi:hypothetical protein
VTDEMCILGGFFYPAPAGKGWNCFNGDNLDI